MDHEAGTYWLPARKGRIVERDARHEQGEIIDEGERTLAHDHYALSDELAGPTADTDAASDLTPGYESTGLPLLLPSTVFDSLANRLFDGPLSPSLDQRAPVLGAVKGALATLGAARP